MTADYLSKTIGGLPSTAGGQHAGVKVRSKKAKVSSAKLRVAFVVPPPCGRGGWSTAVRGIVRSLAENVEPILIVSSADAAAASEIFPGVEAHALPEIQPEVSGDLRIMVRMAPTLLALRRLPPLGVDLVHSLEMFPAGWVGDTIARAEGVPHVLTAFGTYSVIWRQWPIAAHIYRGVLRRAAYLCPMSHGTAERMRAKFREAIQNTPLEVVLQGSEFSGRVARKVAEKKTFPREPVVLSAGEIKPRKGYHVSLRAFARLQKKFPQARYVLAGGGLGGGYHRELLALIQREGIRNVEFPGLLDWDKLDPLYRGASMLAMTSREEGDHFEGFVFVFLEAGAYGLPVVGTRTGGIPDAVIDGRTGFLLPMDDVEGIAQAMIRLAEDRRLSRRMGLAGRARAEELTWERYARQQTAVYQKVVREKLEKTS